MRGGEDLVAVRSLTEQGLSDCAVARATGVPRTTVRDWRRSARWASTSSEECCAVCRAPVHRYDHLPPSYVYLLGLYLGDGCLSEGRRGVFKMRVVLDDRYPAIIRECRQAMGDLLPTNRVSVTPRRDQGCSDVGVYSRQLLCLFPQHGPGPKHRRRIALRPWQAAMVAAYPQLLLRGLVHSDGCRAINTVTVRGKRYSYPRYQFTNRSADIRGLFCDTCDRLGIEWRPMNVLTVSVARARSFAQLDGFIGPKA